MKCKLFNKKVKKIDNDKELIKQLKRLKAEHIKRISIKIPKMSDKNYICSWNELKIELNTRRDSFIRITSDGIHLNAYFGRSVEDEVYKYIKEHINIVMFIVKEMKCIEDMDLNSIIGYLRNYNYKQELI